MFIVFDLDGTLADCEHRRYLVHKDRAHPRWQEFYERCHLDAQIRPVVEIFWALDAMDEHRIEIWSGRCESVRHKSRGWLLGWVTPETSRLTHMRPVGNTEPDDVLKERWLLALPPSERPQLVFDDRRKVVDMWRRHSIPCMQVAPGEF